MLIENVEAVVVTLKAIALPLLTLMSVANPWMVLSPDPVTSHSDFGLPASWFSHTTGFGPHCALSGHPAGRNAATRTTRATPAPGISRRTVCDRRDVMALPGCRWALKAHEWQPSLNSER